MVQRAGLSDRENCLKRWTIKGKREKGWKWVFAKICLDTVWAVLPGTWGPATPGFLSVSRWVLCHNSGDWSHTDAMGSTFLLRNVQHLGHAAGAPDVVSADTLNVLYTVSPICPGQIGLIWCVRCVMSEMTGTQKYGESLFKAISRVSELVGVKLLWKY